VYGGAGVHVDHLVSGLRPLVDVDVHCFGGERDEKGVHATRPWPAVEDAALQALSVDLVMAAAAQGADVAHSHTWYANLGGHLAKLLHGIPHVMTTHSLEPRRPWKAEQLGGGYQVALFCERTAIEAADAVVAVSAGMRDDVLGVYPDVDPRRVEVIHNGIDTDAWRPDRGTEALERFGIDPDVPTVVFLGRVTRQKGVDTALEVAARIRPEAQMVLCAGAPDTPEIGEEMRARAAELSGTRGRVFWLEEMLPKQKVRQILTHASVFLCPSAYEPFGLTNLEAMACELPVVATAVGGIPEIVVEGETGFLVPWDPDPAAFADALAAPIDELLGSPERAEAMGQAGRRRAVEHFGWPAVAARTVELYHRVCSRR
jgi:starch synthase